MTYRRKAFDVPATSPAEMLNLVRWSNGEFQKIEIESTKPETRGLQFEVLQELPQRYKEGDLYYGAPGVFGGQAGLYIRDSNSWRKL